MRVRRTPEEVAVDDALEQAVKDALRVYNRIPETAIVVGFTLVFEATSFDAERDIEYEHHGLMHMGATERRSVARGRLEIGIERLNIDCAPRDDDD